MLKSLLTCCFLLSILHLCSAQRPVVVMGSTGSFILQDEGTRFSVCFDLDRAPAATDFEVTVTSNTPAISDVNVVLVFLVGEAPVEQCIDDILVVVDGVFEIATETVIDILRVSTFYDNSTGPDELFYSLLITDNTAISADFEMASYTFIESDDSVTDSVCVALGGTIAGTGGTLTATVSVMDNTTEPGDYFLLTTSLELEFSFDQLIGCINFNIRDDDELEGAEVLTVSLIDTDSNRFDISQATVATVTIIDRDGDCGPPPSGSNVTSTLSGPYIEDGATFVTNQGAMAAYACDDPEATLVGIEMLECVSVMVNGTETGVEWNSDAPICEPPVIITSETTTQGLPITVDKGGLSAEERRNIGLGVGIGVGGALIILVIVIIIIVCVVRVKKGQKHSKYVLNYNTVYGEENRRAKPPVTNEYVADTSKTAAV